jgi:hypothetical protein
LISTPPHGRIETKEPNPTEDAKDKPQVAHPENNTPIIDAKEVVPIVVFLTLPINLKCSRMNTTFIPNKIDKIIVISISNTP